MKEAGVDEAVGEVAPQLEIFEKLKLVDIHGKYLLTEQL